MEGGSYIESSDAFSAFYSVEQPGLIVGKGAGLYVGSSFVVGERGRVTVGEFSIINGCSIICNGRVSIGAHCLIAWSSVITDTWPEDKVALAIRRAAMKAVARDPLRCVPIAGPSRSVTIEDNVWVGFGAVIMPGVRLGHGSVIGCRTVVRRNVEPYTVIAGDPPRVVKQLAPDDTSVARNNALREMTKPQLTNLARPPQAHRERAIAITTRDRLK